MRDLERDLRGLNICGRPLHQQDLRKSRNDSRPSTSLGMRSRSNSRRHRSASIGSNASNRSRRRDNSSNYWSLNDFKNQIRSRYDWQVLRIINDYVEANEISAEVVNTENYLRRCYDTGLIPEIYWVTVPGIRHTKDVTRLLDKCSFQLMCKDLKNNRVTRQKLDARIDGLDKRLSKVLSQRDFLRLLKITKQHRDIMFSKIRSKQRKEFNDLRKVVMKYEQQLEKKKTSPKKSSRTQPDKDPNDSGKEQENEGERTGRVQRRRTTSLSSKEGSEDD